MTARPRVIPLLAHARRGVLSCVEQVLLTCAERQDSPLPPLAAGEALAAVRRLARAIPPADDRGGRPGACGRFLTPGGEPAHVPFGLADTDPADVAALAETARLLADPQAPVVRAALETVSAQAGMPPAELAARTAQLAQMLDMAGMAGHGIQVTRQLLTRAARGEDTRIVLKPADLETVAELTAQAAAAWATRM
jgi:hypothetical protein